MICSLLDRPEYPANMLPNVIFLDRDGVINQDSPAYIKSEKELIFLPGSIEAISHLHKKGIKVVVITNQSGVNRNLYSWATLEAMHHKLRRTVQEQGGEIAGIFICPHLPTEHCICRKPAPGLMHQAEKTLSIKAAGQPFVGDSERDVLCARAVGSLPILVATGNGIKTQPLYPEVPFYASLWEYSQSL